MTKWLEIKTTTNSRVHKILYKQKYASCAWDSWHPIDHGDFNNENDSSWKVYAIYKEDFPTCRDLFPSWKLVSKNKKQWMKKPIYRAKIQHHMSILDDTEYIRWKM